MYVWLQLKYIYVISCHGTFGSGEVKGHSKVALDQQTICIFGLIKKYNVHV